MTSVPAPLADLESAPRGDAPTDRPPGRGWRHRYSLVKPSPALAKAATRAGGVAGPALAVTLGAALVVAIINSVAGLDIAWVLVRDDFRGKAVVSAVIDLPFALPTIVAGLTLLALYGASSPFHVDLAGTRLGVGAALLFVTLPFCVR